MDEDYADDPEVFDLGLDEDEVADATLDEGGEQTAAVAHAAVRNNLASTRGALTFETPPPHVDARAMFPDSNETVKPRLVNTLCMLTLGRVVDLRVLACGARNVEYDATRHAAVIRLREPPCAGLVRIKGTVTIAGASSIAAARRAAVIIARIIRAVMGWQDELKKITFWVKSFMVRFDLRHPVSLESLAASYPNIASYEPETFCGCTIKLRGFAGGQEWSAAANVYVSGKVNIVGVKTAEALQAAYDGLLPLIAPHARGANPKAPALAQPAQS
jgi:TATA-box binding protein (TBP) (component of TFIID and TFIIIB)